MKTVLIIGLGRFGSTMAMKLHELGHEVMAIDTSEERINAVLPYVTSAQIGDCTNEQYMSSLGIRNFDVCVVAIGDNFQSSLEITSLLKDLGAKFVLSRASRDIHAKFLLRNGADQVVYPEKEMAVRSAVRYSSDNIFDYIELTQEHSIYEIPVPDAWIGKSIVDMNVRNKYNITILAIKYSDTLHPLPGASYVFKPNDILVILGANRDINRFVH
ncbi:TrkA family potassium uptake protein [[Clostridium] symbiosum]|uniref:potassium channel family protein n=1 Tax=Clostridium symbiosum TaxID=1512 RepID=UPI001D07EA67|nr:TrkA family potassium uptake protein [[Clostridium] symbiosum]MCB6607553.1 TrkA family potassium uptake protein [[Clostridium] symbiosum]MCB6930701.1 TrkA family potassium uptake protein [[Clostridium] symbiosum]